MATRACVSEAQRPEGGRSRAKGVEETRRVAEQMCREVRWMPVVMPWTGTRSNTGNARRDVEVTDGLGSWSVVSRGHRDTPAIRNGTNTTADAKEIISTCRNALKTRGSPVVAGRRDHVKPGSHACTPNMHIDTHGDALHEKAGDTEIPRQYKSNRPKTT